MYFLIALLHSIMTRVGERHGQLKTNAVAISIKDGIPGEKIAKY